MSSGVMSVATGALKLLGGRVATTLARIVYVVALTRYLGPERFGVLAYGQSFYLAFLPFSAVALAAIMVREVGIDKARGARSVDRMLALQLITSTLAAVGCAVAGVLSEDGGEVRLILLIFSLALFGRSLALWTRQVFIAYEVTGYAFWQEALFRPGEVALALGVVVAGGDVLALASVHALMWWGQGAIGLWLIRSRVTPLMPQWKLGELMAVVKRGIPLLINGFTLAWLLEGPLVLFRQSEPGGHAVGQMGLLMQVVNQLNAMSAGVVFVAALPVLSRMASGGQKGEFRFVEVVTRQMIVATAGLAIVGAALGPTLLPLVFGADYADAASLLGPGLALLGPLLIAAAANQVLVAQGRFGIAAVASCLGAGLLTLSFYVGRGDLEAVLYEIFIVRGVWALLLLVILARSGGMSLLTAMLRPLAAALLTWSCWTFASPFGLMVALGASLATLILASWALGVVTPLERAVAGDILARLRGRHGKQSEG